MSKLLKEEVSRFVFIFLTIFTIDYFFDWVSLGAIGALGVSSGIIIGDLILYVIKRKRRNNI